MLRRRVTTIVATVVLGSVALTACGSGEEEKKSDAAASSSELSINSGTPEQNNAKKGTGDWAVGTKANNSVRNQWIALIKTPEGNVVNGAGLGLYRFDDDEANPSKATCNGPCATVWPPVLVTRNTTVHVRGITNPNRALGTVKRADGTFQLTIGGWPVYRFNQDTARGDLKGQGRDGKWFAIAPDGQKAQLGNGSTGGNTGGSGGNNGGGESQQPGRRGAMTLLNEPNDISESNPAQRIKGAGCVNVGPEDVASAIRDISGGSVKIWSERDCKGESRSVSADVLDLGTIGFDNKLSSVFFG